MEGRGSLTEFLDHPFVFLTREGATPCLWAGHLSVAQMTHTQTSHDHSWRCEWSQLDRNMHYIFQFPIFSPEGGRREREICVSHSRREQQLAQSRAARHPRPFTHFRPTSLPECNLLVSACL